MERDSRNAALSSHVLCRSWRYPARSLFDSGHRIRRCLAFLEVKDRSQGLGSRVRPHRFVTVVFET